MAEKDERGRAGEACAARYLEGQGYAIVDRNWRIGAGELDLVVVRGRELVVVEVKARASEAYGHPFEAVDGRKRQRLWRLALAWAAAHPATARGRSVRIDVVGLVGADPATARVEHLRDLR